MKISDLRQILWANIFQNQDDLKISKLQFLYKIPFFKELTRWQIMEITTVLHSRNYDSGEYLFEQNHPGAALFIIKSGEISIELGRPGSTDYTQLAVLNSGTFMGELALLDQSLRSASARATEPTQCYALFRNDLDNLSETEPQIACKVYKALASIVGDRLKSTNDFMTLKKGA